MKLVVKEDSQPIISDRGMTVYVLGYPKTMYSVLLLGNEKETFIPIYQMLNICEIGVEQPKVELIIKKEGTEAKPVYIIEEGYHAFTKLTKELIQYSKDITQQRDFKVRVAKFIIPQDSTYFLQGNNIVSSTIIFKELIK